MRFDVDVVSPVQRRVRVELPAAAVDEEFSRAYEGINRRARIRGFRPGKAPRSVLKGIYGEEVRSQVFARLVERSLEGAFREQGLQAVSRPKVEAGDLEEGKSFSFSAVIEIKPEIALKNYLGLQLEKVKLSVEDSQVDVALRRLQESHAHLEPVEDRDVVERGDFVALDFAGFVDGKPLAGAKTENYQLEVGARNALPQFEEGVVGLKKHQEHIISVPYPEDYFNRDLAGKVTEFRVTVRDIKKKMLPPLDDEFAKDHGECASLAELKDKMRSRLQRELEAIQSRQLKEQILTRVIEEHSFEVPAALLDRELRYLAERHQRRLAQAQASSQPVPSFEELRKEMEPQALREVKAMLLMEKIAWKENIGVSDEELRLRVEEMARSAGEKGSLVREFYRQRDALEDLRAQMVFDRTLDFLLSRATIKEVEPAIDARDKKS